MGSTRFLSSSDCNMIIRRDSPRHGWDEAFRAAGPSNDGELLLDSVPADEFDREEWWWEKLHAWR